MNRRLLTFILALFSMSGPTLAGTLHGNLYKDRNCPCCESHAEYLKENGINVDVHAVDDIATVSKDVGIPSDYQGCHTIILDGAGYVVEGHVTAELIRKLLKHRTADVIGISIPGMPPDVPGMAGPSKYASVTVYAIKTDGTAIVFATQ